VDISNQIVLIIICTYIFLCALVSIIYLFLKIKDHEFIKYTSAEWIIKKHKLSNKLALKLMDSKFLNSIFEDSIYTIFGVILLVFLFLFIFILAT